MYEVNNTLSEISKNIYTAERQISEHGHIVIETKMK